MNFTLNTEPGADVPEFTISCLTHGGPATTVNWTVNGVTVQEDSDHETSQLIVSTSFNSVYDNRLRVRGRRSGTYNCTVSNNIRLFFRQYNGPVNGILLTLGKMTSFRMNLCIRFFSQLQEMPLILLQSSLSLTLQMSISLCIGSHQVVM